MTQERLYRASALASGAVRMWRGWRVLVPVVIVNALVQAALVWPYVTYAAGWWVAVSALLSAVVFVLAYGLVGVTALAVPRGQVDWATAAAGLRARLVPYLGWALAWLVALAIGLALYSVPGLVLLAVTPFLLLSVLDGRGNPLAWNVRVIGRRFWRWLVTIAITGTMLLVADLATGLFTFFTRVPFAALVVWLVGGFVVAWWTTAWALIYRSATAPDLDEPDPARILGEKATRGGAAR